MEVAIRKKMNKTTILLIMIVLASVVVEAQIIAADNSPNVNDIKQGKQIGGRAI